MNGRFISTLGIAMAVIFTGSFARADSEQPVYKIDTVPVVIISNDRAGILRSKCENTTRECWKFWPRINEDESGYEVEIDSAIRYVPTSKSVESGFKGVMDKMTKLDQQLNSKIDSQKGTLEVYINQQLKDIKAGNMEAVILEILSDPQKRGEMLRLLSPEIASLKSEIEELKKKINEK